MLKVGNLIAKWGFLGLKVGEIEGKIGWKLDKIRELLQG